MMPLCTAVYFWVFLKVKFVTVKTSVGQVT